MAINNPYIPGDPCSYDLKWIVAKIKVILQQLGTLDEAIEEKIFEGFLEHSIVQFHNVADMLAADMKDGSVVLTLGYYEPGDLGSMFYLIKDFNPGQCSLDYFLTMDNNAQIAIPVFMYPWVTPEMFGAKGDGTTDDREAIQKALDLYGKVVFTKKYGISIYERSDTGTYQKIGLLVPENANLTFNEGSEIVLLNNSVPDYVMLLLENVNHVTVTGGTITGDKLTYTVTTTEWCHGFAVDGCEDVKFENVTCRYQRGDGIEFGNLLNKNVTMKNCIMKDNGRNGTSVLNVYGMSIDGCSFTGTNRTAPMKGLCLEPAALGQSLKDVRITNCHFADNTFGAIQVASITDADNVLISNCYCDGSVSVGIKGEGSAVNVNDSTMIGAYHNLPSDPGWPYYSGVCLAVGCVANSVLNVKNAILDMRNEPVTSIMFVEQPGDDHKNIHIEATITNGTCVDFGLNRSVPVSNCSFKITRTPSADFPSLINPLLPNQDDASNRLEIYGVAKYASVDSVPWTGSYYEIVAGQNTNVNVIQIASSELIVKNADTVGHNLINATFKSLIDGTTTALLNIPAGDTLVLKYVPSLNQIVYY